jgi:hypothetical protein
VSRWVAIFKLVMISQYFEALELDRGYLMPGICGAHELLKMRGTLGARPLPCHC